MFDLLPPHPLLPPRLLNPVNHHHSIKSLNNISNQKLNLCQRFESDTHAAVLWMREQKTAGNFKGNVYEPARISVSLKDAKYAQMAENPISVAMFKVRSFLTPANNLNFLTLMDSIRRSCSRSRPTTTT